MQKFKVFTSEQVVLGFHTQHAAQQYARTSLPHGTPYKIYSYTEYDPDRASMPSASRVVTPEEMGIRHGRPGPRPARYMTPDEYAKAARAAASESGQEKARRAKRAAQGLNEPSYHELRRLEAARFQPKWKRK